jgi:hypothetical protein
MEQTENIQTPTRKIYKDRAIWAGTFLGGPLVAGYLIAVNFNVFNDPAKAKKTWIYSIIATCVIFGGLYLIPNPEKIPKQIIPLIYTAIAYYIVQHYQGTKINSHINSGGQTYNWWRAFGIGLIGTVITVLPFIALAYFTDPTFTATSKTYGTLKHEILFNKNNISEDEINQIANGLTQTTFFDEAQKKQVFVKKDGKKYIIIIAVIDNTWNDPIALSPFIQLRADLQTLFPNNKIVLDLCIDLDNIKKRLE